MQEEVFTAIRSFLLPHLSGFDVVEFQNNRVPEPDGDFVIMSSLGGRRLSLNGDTYGDATVAILQPWEMRVQLDFHSADTTSSADAATKISALFRSWYAVDAFKDGGLGVTPLYADDARQRPFVNAEQEYETRWTLDVAVQINTVYDLDIDTAQNPGSIFIEPPSDSLQI